MMRAKERIKIAGDELPRIGELRAGLNAKKTLATLTVTAAALIALAGCDSPSEDEQTTGQEVTLRAWPTSSRSSRRTWAMARRSNASCPTGTNQPVWTATRRSTTQGSMRCSDDRARREPRANR